MRNNKSLQDLKRWEAQSTRKALYFFGIQNCLFIGQVDVSSKQPLSKKEFGHMIRITLVGECRVAVFSQKKIPAYREQNKDKKMWHVTCASNFSNHSLLPENILGTPLVESKDNLTSFLLNSHFLVKRFTVGHALLFRLLFMCIQIIGKSIFPHFTLEITLSQQILGIN